MKENPGWQRKEPKLNYDDDNNNNSNSKVNHTSAVLRTTHQAQHHHIGIAPVSGAQCRITLHQKELHRSRELRRVTRVRIQKRGC